MRKRIAGVPILIATLLAMLAVCVAFMAQTKVAAAETENANGDYSFEFTDFNVTYDISADRSMDVTEYITVRFTGRHSTGFIKDIPVNGNELVKNIDVKILENGELHEAFYNVEMSDDGMFDSGKFISVDIGDSMPKINLVQTYVITYKYCLTKAQEGENFLYLNAIGVARDCAIERADVKLIVPKGYKNAEYYLGKGGNDKNHTVDSVESRDDGKSVIELLDIPLASGEGISFLMEFDDGALSGYFDITPYYYVIAIVALAVVMAVVKVLFFSKNTIVPVTNFEAPDRMDPLIMGKLIDNKVNSEDVTALIYYWADKGYLKINLDNKNDPSIIKIRNLPATAAEYEQVVFAGLFRRGDAVKPSELTYNFYNTFERAKSLVNEQSGGLFRSVSVGVSILFALLSGILVGIAPMVMGITTVSNKLVYFFSVLAIIPALIMYGVSETVIYNRLKNKKMKNLLYCLLLVIVSATLSLLYAVLVPNVLMPALPNFILSFIGFLNVCAAVTLIDRTPAYAKKLNDIVGFRNFILYTEKDKLERMLNDNPQLYYHILPYAQVLNVSDIWEDKFKDITVPPPVWATSSATDSLLNFIIINSLIRNSVTRISANMISRPSASGSGGNFGGFGHGGNFGGGSVGGGHGGGGFRGR